MATVVVGIDINNEASFELSLDTGNGVVTGSDVFRFMEWVGESIRETLEPGEYED